MGLIGDPQKLNLHIYTVGMGSKEGGKIPEITQGGEPIVSAIDEKILEELSKKGNGQYYFANGLTATDIAKDVIIQMAKENPESEIVSYTRTVANKKDENLVYDLYYQFPLGVAIVLLGMFLFLPDTNRLKKKGGGPSLMILGGLFCLFHFSSLHAASENPDDQMRVATAFFEAKEFPEAIKIFEGMLQQKLSPHQEAIVSYNLGTSLLANGKFQDAIAVFNKISIDPSTSLLLIWRLKENIAIAKLSQALAITKTVDKSPLSSKDFQKAISLYNDALKELNLASIAECKFAQLEGRKSCEQSQELQQIRNFVEYQLVDLTSQYRNFQISQMSLKKALPLLLVSLNVTLTNVNFIQNQHLEGDIRKKYLETFVAQGDMWLPLWNALRIQADSDFENKKISGEELQKFVEAQKYFAYILRYLEKDRIENSQHGALDAIADIRALAKSILKPGDEKILVEGLLNSYSNALEQIPLQEAMLRRLEIEQEQTEQLMATVYKDQLKAKDFTFLKAKLTLVKGSLLAAIEALGQSSMYEGRFYLEEALQELKRIHHHLDSDQLRDVKAILKNGIEEQRHARSLEKLALEINNKDKEKETGALILASQKKIKALLDPFLHEVYTQQFGEFNAQLKPDKMDERCQNSPWNEVIPLFFKGQELASKVEKTLEHSFTPSTQIEIAQGNVIKNWELALAKLEQPKSFFQGCSGKMSENSQKESKPDESNSNESKFEDVLRLLQVMQNEDAKPQLVQPIQKQGIKPW